jgi:hypothetical protein
MEALKKLPALNTITVLDHPSLGLCSCSNTKPEYTSKVQWGTNQNVVFKIAVRKLSRLPTLKASRELKNWYFPTKFLPKHYLQVSYICAEFQDQKIH